MKEIKIELYFGNYAIADLYFVIEVDFNKYPELELELHVSKKYLRYIIMDGKIKIVYCSNEKQDTMTIQEEFSRHISINYQIEKMLYYINKRLLGDEYNKSYRDIMNGLMGDRFEEQVKLFEILKRNKNKKRINYEGL